MSGCSISTEEPKIKNESLTVIAIPSFPPPHPDVVKELKEVCPKDKCVKLYDWLQKMMVFKNQLAILKEPTI